MERTASAAARAEGRVKPSSPAIAARPMSRQISRSNRERDKSKQISSGNRNLVIQFLLLPIAGGACETFVPDATDDEKGVCFIRFRIGFEGGNFFTPNARNPLKRLDSKK